MRSLTKMRLRHVPGIVILVGLTACTPPAQEAPPAVPLADQWLGQWTGPEGTFLKIGGGRGRYEITIQNLDGPRTFTGAATEHGIRFERDGVREEIRATDGVATGMKWLKDKTNCLTVREGEGYCRD